MYIKKMKTTVLPQTTGSITDTLNVTDKVTNAPSVRLTNDILAAPVNSIIAYDGDIIPEGYEEVISLNEYSTNEVIIGTWFGKPLYRRIYNTSTGNRNEDTAILTYDSNFEIVNFSGIVTLNNIKHSINMYHNADHTISTYVRTDTHQIWCKYIGRDNNAAVTLCLEYTKTTD